jgi:dipeptidyl-peptidase-4
MELATHKETRLTSNGSETLRNGETDWVYPEELALGTAYWWSPDSRSIAFLQFDVSREPLYPQVDLRKYRAMLEPQRYPQAGEPNADVALGVVPVSGGPTRWMDVGSTRYQYLIARVEWMPDARHLAVQRLTRIQDRLELMAADSTTGETRLMLRETDPYWINVSKDLRFLEDGKRFLWSSERDGYRHLYLYSVEGRLLRQLTDGAWELRGVAGIDTKTDRVYYLSSEASPMETQLYSIRLNGKDKTRVTNEPGTHAISFSPDGGYFADSYSNKETPSRRVLRTAQGTEYAVLRESNRSASNEYELIPSEVVTIKAADGKTELYGSITKPAGFQSGRKYPAIVVVYGGPGAQSVVNSFRSLTMQQMMAHRGYVVWELDNRGSAGRGHLFEAGVNRSLGTAELADQKAGVDYLTSLGYVDAERIGVYGWSYGGFMTLNCVLNAPGTFRAGIAGAPVTNFANYDTIYTERYMGLPTNNPDGYKKTDLSLRAGNLKSNLMIVHNFQDDNVLFQNTLQIVDALERADKRFELMIYPQKSHGVTGPVRRQMLESMMEFFDRTLKF